MSAPAPRAELLKRADYRYLRPITTRWMDNDAYGHVNNVVYYSFFDTAVNAHLIEAGLLDVVHSPVIGLVVETRCTFKTSLAFPSLVMRIARGPPRPQLRALRHRAVRGRRRRAGGAGPLRARLRRARNADARADPNDVRAGARRSCCRRPIELARRTASSRPLLATSFTIPR